MTLDNETINMTPDILNLNIKLKPLFSIIEKELQMFTKDQTGCKLTSYAMIGLLNSLITNIQLEVTKPDIAKG